jgi:hypothetical protein
MPSDAARREGAKAKPSLSPQQLYKRPSALEHLDHLDHLQAAPAFRAPSTLQKLLLKRTKRYRIVLHSDDRISGTPADALFDVGDLRGAFGLPLNLDAGGRPHYEAAVVVFQLSGVEPLPPIIEARGPQGWPHLSESFDSRTRGPSDLLCVVSGTNEDVDAIQRFTLRELPNGHVRVRLVTRDTALDEDCACTTSQQGLLDDNPNLKWQLVMDLEPVHYE